MTEPDAVQSLLAVSGEHRRGEEQAPRRYKVELVPEFKGKILETLARLEWGYIGTVSEEGWPFTSASRLIFSECADQRPILYALAKAGSVTAAHIAGNPRVGVESHLAVGWLERRKARALQFQAIASLLDDLEETARIASEFARRYKSHNDFTLDASDIIVRLVPLSVVNFYATGRPQWGYVDYTLGN